MSIQAANLHKQFGTQIAVNSISFQTKAGEIIGFLGPNGAGKSTTIKMLMGLLTPSSGQAFILGKEVNAQNANTRKSIGYLAENNPLYADMYVKEFLAFIAQIHSVPRMKQDERIKEVIELVGLQKEQHKKINTLSKGYQQRVGIAQAILHDPEILILDEPTSGLDPNQMAEIRQLIVSLKKNKTILFSSHLLSEVEAICDRVILIHQGEMKADCSIEEAKQFPGGMLAFFQSKTANLV